MVDVTRKLEIGRVFRDTIAALRREGGLLAGLTLLLSLPGVALSLIQFVTLGPVGARDPQFMSSPIYWGSLLLSTVIGLVMWAAQLHVGIAALEGRRVELRDSLAAGVRKLAPLIGVFFLSGLGAALGMLLFVVPGVILALMWAVSSPVIVGETSNVMKALGRSRQLTKGNRWRIFGLATLIWIIAMVVFMALGVVGGVFGLLTPGGLGALFLVVSSVATFVFYLVLSVGTAALYVQLRELKGGGAAVAQVFA